MAIWERGKIVKFFQDKQVKAEAKEEKHGKHHGGAVYGTSKSEARPTDKSGAAIPPPPRYVLPPSATPLADVAYAPTHGTGRSEGPVFSAPAGVGPRFESRPVLLREIRVTPGNERPTGGWWRRIEMPTGGRPWTPRPYNPGPGGNPAHGHGGRIFIPRPGDDRYH